MGFLVGQRWSRFHRRWSPIKATLAFTTTTTHTSSSFDLPVGEKMCHYHLMRARAPLFVQGIPNQQVEYAFI